MQVQILSHTQGKLSQSLYYTKWMCLLGILPTNNHTWNNNEVLWLTVTDRGDRKQSSWGIKCEQREKVSVYNSLCIYVNAWEAGRGRRVRRDYYLHIWKNKMGEESSIMQSDETLTRSQFCWWKKKKPKTICWRNQSHRSRQKRRHQQWQPKTE